MIKTFVVYMATNTVNGKRYIGATSRGLDVRRRKHFQDAKATRPGCRVFNAAIRKYGEDVFKWEIIAIVSSFDEMMEKEIELIGEMKPEYNITRGGKGIVGVPRTAEWLAKMSKAMKGRKLPAEQIAAMRLMDKSYQFKSVVCLNDGLFFNSVKSAAVHYGISKNNLWGMLKGRHIRCKGLSFAFSPMPMSPEEIKFHLDELNKRLDDWKFRKNSDKRRPVVCLTDGVEYESARAAAKKCGISPARVMQLCQGGGATLSGLTFKYADQEHAPQKRVRTAEQVATQRRLVLEGLARGQAKIKKRVVCLDNGKTFDSITDAAKAFSLNMSALAAAISRGQKCGGYTFKAISASDPIVVPQVYTRDPLLGMMKGNARRVICCEDNRLFNSVSEAVRCYGVNRRNLTVHLENGGIGAVGGMRFSYLDEWCPNPE